MTAPAAADTNVCNEVSDDVPTSRVMVPATWSTAVIFTAVWYAASGVPALAPSPEARGYVFWAVWPSRAQVNVSELSASLTEVPAVKVWVPIVNSKRPVEGVYVAAVGVKLTRGEAPTLTVIVPAAWSTAVISRVLFAAGSVERGYVLVTVLPSIAHVKDSESVSRLIPLPTSNPWLAPIVRVVIPVTGVYSAFVTLKYTKVEKPTNTKAFWPWTSSILRGLLLALVSRFGLGYDLTLVLLSLLQVNLKLLSLIVI